MKKLIVSLGLALTLSFGATFNEGVEAFEKGDYKTALSIFEDLSSTNNSEAQYYLGFLYYNGQGVKQDFKKAKEWFGKACDNRDQESCDNYKKLNEQGF